MNKYSKIVCTIIVMAMAVIFFCIGECSWKILQLILDGETHTSKADFVVNIVLVTSIGWPFFKKCLDFIHKNS